MNQRIFFLIFEKWMNSHREVSSIREIYLKKKMDNKKKKRF